VYSGITFVGDIASPTPITNRAHSVMVPSAFECVVANLEGALVRDTEPWFDKCVIFNDVSVLDYLLSINTRVAILANNHTMDIPSALLPTCETLRGAGILVSGAGENRAAAERAVALQYQDRQIVILSFGWETIGCIAASDTNSGVNPLRPTSILNSLTRVRKLDPRSAVVAVFHWNYELEVYPQPMHRDLAFACIDHGADLVIGSHPHIPGGIEWHCGRPVVYSLGNWQFRQRSFFNGRVYFPSAARSQLAVQWDPATGQLLCHWFTFCPETSEVSYGATEDARISPRIRELTPFRGFSAAEYRNWFRAARTRRKGLPIYDSYEANLGNAFRDIYIRGRHQVIRTLIRIGIR
jgi:poly-gamma-glutamate synthesis protein (capsule biosynthesis protein)